jgi:hypothetical protein
MTTCKSCTFINQVTATKCDMCDNKLEKQQWNCLKCTFLNDMKTHTCSMCGEAQEIKKTSTGKVTVFDEQRSVAFMAGVSNSKLQEAYEARAKKLGFDNSVATKFYHLSLMVILVNMKNPDCKFIVEDKKLAKDLVKIMSDCYKTVSKNINLTSIPGKYETMGDFMAKIYESTDSKHITTFRMAFYQYLENKLGMSTRRQVMIDSKEYFIYSYNGKDLIAIPGYFHGKGVWKPHMSLAKLTQIKQVNPLLFSQYEKRGITILAESLKGSMGYIDKVNMENDFSKLTLSVL